MDSPSACVAFRAGRAAHLLTALLAFGASAAAQGIGSHLSVGTVAGEGAGLDDGYVHLGGFVPIAQPDAPSEAPSEVQSLWFADGSLMLFNGSSDQLGGNVGVGYRSLCDATGSILGGYAYFDRRDLGTDEFNQIGGGVESIGELFDGRLNFNAPLDDTQTTNVAFTTIDGEVGALLIQQDQLACRSFVGVYGLFHDDLDDAAGVRGRLELRIADQCFVGGYLEHDDLFDTTGGFTFEYRFGRGGSASDDSSQTLLARLGDRVNRRRHVVTAEASDLGVTITGLSVPTPGPGSVTPTPEPPVTPGTVDPVTPGRPYRPPPRSEF